MVSHKLQYSTAHSSLYCTIFNGNNLLKLFKHFMKQLLIQRLNKSQVIMSRIYSLFIHYPTSFDSFITNMSDSKNGKIFPITNLSSLSDLNSFHRPAPVYHYTFSTRIANSKWPHI